MDVEISVNGLSNLLKNERKTGEIITLQNNFYAKIDEKLKSFGNQETDECKNISKITSGIKERRIQKLLVYIAYNKELPKPIPTQEEDLYMQIRKILNKNNTEASASKIRISKTIPEVLTPSGSKIGPYEQNQTVYVQDILDAKFIIDNKLGEIIE